jgi:eukaryotic-like serine/threonine-protein kinase
VGFEIGQRVADYEIVSLLGVGGMSRVYRVRNVISHRIEAMKVLLADLNAEPDMAARFASEIRTLAGLDHPNIAQLHTALQVGNELVMMMEFVDGSTLQQLAKQAPLSLEKTVDYMHQVLAALSFAHHRGVVHRDVKPANIMVTPQGIAKLTDFGIAKSKLQDELTRPGTTVGSLYYMSPEQALGGRTVDGRSDIYSVGIMMYELLAGCRPFEDESAYVILHSQLTVVPPPPVEVNPLLSKPLSDLILKALEKDPAKRFQTAGAFSKELRRVTGIAPSKAAEISAVSATKTAPVPAVGARVVPAAKAAETSRFTTSSRRGLWFAAEAVAVVTVLVFSALGLPHFFRAGATAKTTAHSATQGLSLPLAPQNAVAAPKSEQNAAMVVPDELKPVNTPLANPETAKLTLPLKPATQADATPTDATPADDSATTAAPAPPHARATAGSSNLSARPAKLKLSRVEYQPASLPNTMPKTEEDTTPSFPAPKAAALQEARNRKAGLDARAAAVRISVQRLKGQQEAAGNGLGQDVAGAYVRMNAYLGAEKTDLEDGDIASARDHMDKAEYEVSVLEKLFNK